MAATDAVSRVFAALADPTRRAILERLRTGPVTVGVLAEPFAMSRPAISQHLAVLEKAGLVARAPHAQWREVSLAREGVADAEEWLRVHQRVWTARLDRLEERLRASAPPDDPDSHDERTAP